MIHKIFLRAECSRKFNFIDEIKSKETITDVINYYYSDSFNDEIVLGSKKIKLESNLNKLTVIYKDLDHTVWKHQYIY